MTFSEVKLWNELKNSQMMGYDFDRQRPIGRYIVDFFCKDLFLVIEIDGLTHHDEQILINDARRQIELESLGVQFLRFDGLEVVQDLENVLRTIEHWILDNEDRNGIPGNVITKRNQEKPTPAPPRRG
jgi:very-short-patch-repair endonuclease